VQYRAKIDVDCGNNIAQISKMCGQKVEILSVKLHGTCNFLWSVKASIIEGVIH